MAAIMSLISARMAVAPKALFTTWKNQLYMEVINSYIDIAKRIILDVFLFLEDEGYAVQSKVLHSDVFIEECEVRYTNESVNREVSVSYTKGQRENEIRY